MVARSCLVWMVVGASLMLGACSGMHPRPDFPVKFEGEFAEPDTPRHSAMVPSEQEILAAREVQMRRQHGAIYSNASYRPLFEDKRARAVGDLLIVDIVESVSAQQQNNTKLNRDDEASISVPTIKKLLRGVSGSANSSKSFDGGGASNASNQFVGTLTVSVVRVLPNGNLLVAGEKQIGTNNELEFIRMSGVVDPYTIKAGNRVSSSTVADARIQYTGRGAIDSAQTMGWLSRVFLSVLPF